MGFDQQGLERRLAQGVAANRERAQRVAMVALAAGNDMAALRLAQLHEILPRHFERRLQGLRPAADQIHMIKACWGIRDQSLGQALGGF